MKYLTLKELDVKYTNLFINVCKKAEKHGLCDYLKEYEEIKEVCRELHIDTDRIEENIFN